MKNNSDQFKTIVYGFQYLIIGIANCAAVPVVVGVSLGLDEAGIAAFAQRTFFFSGCVCLLQAVFGHRYPILEGPAGIWYSAFIILASMAVQVGKPLALLRTDLEAGLIVAGVITAMLGLFHLMSYIRKIFTPVVNGTFLILLALQFGSTITKGLLSSNGENQLIDLDKIAVFFITLGIIVFLSFKARGFLQSISILIGSACGWISAYIFGLVPMVAPVTGGDAALISFPKLLAWGTPTFDAGVIFTSVISGIVVLSNLVATVTGMRDLWEHPENDITYNRAAACTGVADILAGFGSVGGFIPYASSVGFTALTGIYTIRPFIVGSCLLVFLGVLPPVGHFFAAMPVTVGHAVLFAIFAILIGMGVKESAKNGLEMREMLILGLSVLIGNGISYLPTQAFALIPPALTYVFANGLIVGVVLSILLEHILFHKKLGSFLHQ